MQRLFVAITITALVACNAQPSDDMFPGVDAGAGQNDQDNPPSEKPQLSIDQVEASTPYATIPVTGSGPKNGKVIVETATDSAAEDIGADGNFCIDVPLQTGIDNTLWFKAMDAGGAYSDEVQVTVKQEGDPPDGGNESGEETQPRMRNIAKYGTIDMDIDLLEGQTEFINDGDPQTFARFENNEWATDWLQIELTDSAPIDHIRVRSTSDCPIEGYYVMVTDEADPPDPEIPFEYYEQPWVELAHILDGTGDDTIEPDLSSQPVATRLALILNSGCTYFTQEFEIQEIEVFTQDGGDPPSTEPQGPTCASGGPM